MDQAFGKMGKETGMPSTPAFTFTSAGVVVNVYAEQVGDGVNFTFQTELEDGYRIDLNGFFLDIGSEGGSKTAVGGAKANNMNGGNNDGYDYAEGLGTVGGNDTDYRNGSITIPNITLADLIGADAGLRATSYGTDGEGSLKLVADYCPPQEEKGNHFPDFKDAEGQDISHVTFYFDTHYYNDDTSSNAQDGWFTVKIDNYPGAGNDDLDDDFQAILDHIAGQHPSLDLDTLVGVAIKGGQSQVWYDIDNNPDDVDVPPMPPYPVENKEVDVTYNYESVPDIVLA